MNDNKFTDNLDLPAYYGRTHLTLIPRDPYWIFAHWEISSCDLEKLKKKIGMTLFNKSSCVIRMYDITAVNFNKKNANSSFDVNIAARNGNSYINLPCDNVNYCARLGVSAPDGQFFPLAKSNYASVPRLGSSPRSDLIWMDSKSKKIRPFVTLKHGGSKSPNVKFEDLSRKAKRAFLTEDDIRAYYASIMSLYARKNKKTAQSSKQVSTGKTEIQNKIQKNGHVPENKYLNGIIFREGSINGFSGSSGWMGSSEQKGGASERNKKVRKFFFEIGTELIVYGRTEPDAEVLFNGKKIELRNDGTFGMRFALPDGKIPLDFMAISNDKIDKRTITTSAERAKTRSN